MKYTNKEWSDIGVVVYSTNKGGSVWSKSESKNNGLVLTVAGDSIGGGVATARIVYRFKIDVNTDQLKLLQIPEEELKANLAGFHSGGLF